MVFVRDLDQDPLQKPQFIDILRKSWLYQHSSSLAEGKDDKLFQKKPDIGIELIDRSLRRGQSPGIVLIDPGYGNNTTFLKKLEERELKYARRNRKKSKNSS